MTAERARVAKAGEALPLDGPKFRGLGNHRDDTDFSFKPYTQQLAFEAKFVYGDQIEAKGVAAIKDRARAT